jgi:hypothetical protein
LPRLATRRILPSSASCVARITGIILS